MQKRPTFIDLRSKSSESMNSGIPSPRGLLSPRMQHYDGDIPPAMSPLDMFAAQSRLLARQLDESKRGGRRVSRLPPLTTGDPITVQKSMYNRSRSADRKIPSPGSSARARDEESSGTMPEVEEPAFRPKSFYPRMSIMPSGDDDSEDPTGPSPEDQPFMTPAEFNAGRTQDYFGGAPRARSPDRVALRGRNASATDQNPWVSPPRNYEPYRPAANEPQRGLSTESSSSKSYVSSLAPPRSPHARQAASIRSIPQDSSDDEHSASTGGSDFSRNRKLSSSSGMSMPHSPFTPSAQVHNRSPSLNSEYSLGGTRQARPAFNFSRPLSRDSRPSMDMTSRQPSFDSRPSREDIRPPFSSAPRQPSSDSQRFLFADDTQQTPLSVDSETFSDLKAPPVPSYIYAKFSLPRGRMLQQDSKVLEKKGVPQFEREGSAVQSNVRPATPLANRPLSPSPSPQRSPKPSIDFHRPSPRPSFEQRQRSPPRTSFEQSQGSSPRPSFDQGPTSSPRISTEQVLHTASRPSLEQSLLGPNRSSPTPVLNGTQSKYTASTRSGSTIKARPRAAAPSMEVTAEDHLAKGIALHERGEGRESTYHLRIAAKQGLPTAMLLYALACRHGWGMRPNQQEGVQWLRKAADSAGLEIALDEDPETKPADVLEKKTRRAQFALSIYELGVSHMNGWGIEQDKTLAVRCFEIASNWGDADAMAEAGFCYAQGQGCKKDLKKAAKYYRMAEAKGMSMVGNSWIYKPKYADDSSSNTNYERQGRGATKPPTPEKKPRDKSRTRTIFGRKRSISHKA